MAQGALLFRICGTERNQKLSESRSKIGLQMGSMNYASLEPSLGSKAKLIGISKTFSEL